MSNFPEMEYRSVEQAIELPANGTSLDLLQLEAQLPIELDLLKRQKLRLLVEPVAVRADIGRFQQAHFIVEMKCAHADAGHPRHLFDCISHRRFSAGHHDDARGWRDCQV